VEGGGGGARKATAKPPPLRLHPVRRGATQLYAVADLCEACGIGWFARRRARAFAAGLGPRQRHEARAAARSACCRTMDQGVLVAPAAVTLKYRGPFTAAGGGHDTGAKYAGQDGEVLEVKFDAEAALGRALFPFTPYTKMQAASLSRRTTGRCASGRGSQR
jgi:hypothetical protein